MNLFEGPTTMPTIVIAGNEIAFNLHGDGQESLLFMHGIGTDSSCWTPLVQHFSRTFKCYVFDWKGFGESRLNAPNSTFQLDVLAKELQAICTQLNVKGDFYIVGDNVGALVALAADINDTVKCKGIVAINAADKYKCKIKAKSLLKAIDGSGLKMVDKMNLREQVETRQSLVDQWGKDTGSVDFSSESPYIETPVGFIIGSSNSHVSMKDCEASVGRITNSRVVTLDAGDFPTWQATDELIKEIADFTGKYIPSLSL